MRKHFALGATLALALLVGCAEAGDSVKSGPEVGQGCVPFHPLNVTGQFAGQKQCLV